MNTLWSSAVQGVDTLYLSRELRFHDMFFPRYEPLFRLDRTRPLRILELGCGPGALAGALLRWYPHAEVVGADRDSAFIEFARKAVPGARFLEADIAELPFGEESFDVTISNTVAEHVPPEVFYPAQYRLLRRGGVCICLSARRGVHWEAPCLEPLEEEKAFWARLESLDSEADRTLGVGKYAMTEQELPAAMEKYGFREVSAGYAVADLTPDDPRYPADLAERMVNARKAMTLEILHRAGQTHGEAFPPEEIRRMVDITERKYARRLEQLRRGERAWDTNTSLTMVVRGVRP
jgi:SAM-dependent methyltransferase